MPAIIEAPKIEDKSATFSGDALTQMSKAEGGVPAAKGPTEEQIKASGWFASEGAPSEGDKKTLEVKVEKKGISKGELEQSLEDGEKTAVEGELTDEKKTEVSTTEDEPKEESELPDFLKPPKEETASSEEGKQTDKSVVPSKGGKPFDYAGYSADETRHLKNMDKNAREFTASLIKKSREVVTTENSYLQHPNGYLLAPEYQAATNNMNSSIQLYNHWKNQLLNARAGKNIQDVGVDPKTGQLVITGEIKPTDEVEEACRAQMMSAQQKVDNERAVINEFPKRFKQTLAKDTMAIAEVLKTECPWFAKPELLNYRMDVKFRDGTTKNASLRELKESFLNQFPPYMRNGNIGIEIAANAWLGMLIHQKSAETASVGKKAAEIKTAESRRAEPSTTGKKQDIKKIGGVGEFSTVNAGIEFGQ